MASWPSSLPTAPLVAGYSEQRESGSIRTQIDAGPEFVRRRYSATVTRIGVQLRLTTAQVATLETFFSTTTGQGSAAFTWTHPRTGASVSMRFMEPPQISADGNGIWTAALALEILPA